MTAQDVIFGVGSVCFSIALLPMLIGPEKPPVQTAALTAVWLWVFAIAYMSMGFAFSAETSAVSAWLWTHLGFQSYYQRNNGAS
jgi:hypothetical protein